MKTRVSGVPYEVELVDEYVKLLEEKIERGDMIAELSRENFMLHSRNLRLEDEVRVLDAQVARLTIEVANLKQMDRCPSHDIDDLK